MIEIEPHVTQKSAALHMDSDYPVTAHLDRRCRRDDARAVARDIESERLQQPVVKRVQLGADPAAAAADDLVEKVAAVERDRLTLHDIEIFKRDVGNVLRLQVRQVFEIETGDIGVFCI